MATHSSIFAWEIPWTEDPGGLQHMGLQRVGEIHVFLGRYKAEVVAGSIRRFYVSLSPRILREGTLWGSFKSFILLGKKWILIS